MLRIVAIGGGELPRPDAASDTTELDAEVVRLAGASVSTHSRVLKFV
jgi:hypothetical protein